MLGLFDTASTFSVDEDMMFNVRAQINRIVLIATWLKSVSVTSIDLTCC
ncbi:hypothetical protein THF5H11_20303 [Vibrio jasicida]|uniref:Uncharacterized protein n=1 Tax=Vibrio jasicida TaxID=766224 RepID=A0AAU9QJ01_9VIBR|nr:hypothetical protein THF5H11_20303 [Vibrio jasicida]CAH1569826.1 hypothetical protein THF1C08_160121 [Vibrio jasicida]CAH1577318.1 hypothetical protein THF1A12_140121 [Vibrio jasicida]CAH1608590.1 hypothetical protein THF5G08_60310 [Vibrio jasicida]